MGYGPPAFDVGLHPGPECRPCHQTSAARGRGARRTGAWEPAGARTSHAAGKPTGSLIRVDPDRTSARGAVAVLVASLVAGAVEGQRAPRRTRHCAAQAGVHATAAMAWRCRLSSTLVPVQRPTLRNYP